MNYVVVIHTPPFTSHINCSTPEEATEVINIWRTKGIKAEILFHIRRNP